MDIITPAPRLSLLTIDVDKDWTTHVIKNLGTPVDANDAIRKTDLDSHRTASTIDHPDASVTFSKLSSLVRALIFAGL
jgi:hypothetical protein